MRQLYYDTYGNIYKMIDDKYFILLIDKNDDLTWEQIEREALIKYENKDIKILKIKHVSVMKNDLQNKVVEHLIQDDAYEEHEDYYPESKYFEYEDDEIISDPEEEDDVNELINNVDESKEFSVAQLKDISVIQMSDYYFNEPSCYDTLIIDDKDGTDCDDVVFALESRASNAYRIIFYTSGKTKLDIIGSKTKFQ